MYESIKHHFRRVTNSAAEVETIVRCFRHAAHHVAASAVAVETVVPVFGRDECQLRLRADEKTQFAATLLMAGPVAEQIVRSSLDPSVIGEDRKRSHAKERHCAEELAQAKAWLRSGDGGSASSEAGALEWRVAEMRVRVLLKRLWRRVERVATVLYHRPHAMSEYDWLLLLEHDSEDVDACYRELWVS